MSNLIDRQAAIEGFYEMSSNTDYLCTVEDYVHFLESLSSADVVEVIRCKDCVFGHLYVDVQNRVTDSWIECRNPEGLNRDVSVDGYCSASIRKM